MGRPFGAGPASCGGILPPPFGVAPPLYGSIKRSEASAARFLDEERSEAVRRCDRSRG